MVWCRETGDPGAGWNSQGRLKGPPWAHLTHSRATKSTGTQPGAVKGGGEGELRLEIQERLANLAGRHPRPFQWDDPRTADLHCMPGGGVCTTAVPSVRCTSGDVKWEALPMTAGEKTTSRATEPKRVMVWCRETGDPGAGWNSQGRLKGPPWAHLTHSRATKSTGTQPGAVKGGGEGELRLEIQERLANLAGRHPRPFQWDDPRTADLHCMPGGGVCTTAVPSVRCTSGDVKWEALSMVGHAG
ncbi:hypothetical protein SKAU_G00253590 [Synaphobranchus kaupii]|uniref:Uncharacterized protein n=1 Tax=Synaphobranchus kaupii TaxID=118154 RepID=A0A9Q1F3B9_SYNKA|nr:hypothetical protein SKAU_G00253590 [Synaphobranchus kaupii]